MYNNYRHILFLIMIFFAPCTWALPIIDRFEVELINFEVTPNIGLPQSHTLEFRNFNPFSTGNIFWNLNTGIYIGKTINVSQSSAAYDKMLGLVEGSGIPIPQIYSTIAWGFGGMDVVSTSQFEVRLIGGLHSSILDTAIITVYASGSINTIGGFGTIDKLLDTSGSSAIPISSTIWLLTLGLVIVLLRSKNTNIIAHRSVIA